MSDEQLKDPEFLAALREDLLRFARLQLRDAALAEDAVQEAMLAACQGERQFAGRSALKTWVFAILRNKIVDLLRQGGHTVPISTLSEDEADLDAAWEKLYRENGHWHPASRPRHWGDPQQSLQQQAFWDVFEVCLTRLPENTARIFMMREFLEFDTEEICQQLTLTTSHSHVILHRARQALRACLQKGWFNGEHAPC